MYKLNLVDCTRDEKDIFKLLYNGYALTIYDIHRFVYNDNRLIKLGKSITPPDANGHILHDIDYVIKLSFLMLNQSLDSIIKKKLANNIDGLYTLHQEVINFKRDYMLEKIKNI